MDYNLTASDAYTQTQTQLSDAILAFDRWASQNPERMRSDDPDFQSLKTAIKVLRIKLRDIQKMQLQLQSEENVEYSTNTFVNTRANKLGVRGSIQTFSVSATI